MVTMRIPAFPMLPMRPGTLAPINRPTSPAMSPIPWITNPKKKNMNIPSPIPREYESRQLITNMRVGRIPAQATTMEAIATDRGHFGFAEIVVLFGPGDG